MTTSRLKSELALKPPSSAFPNTSSESLWEPMVHFLQYAQVLQSERRITAKMVMKVKNRKIHAYKGLKNQTATVLKIIHNRIPRLPKTVHSLRISLLIFITDSHC